MLIFFCSNQVSALSAPTPHPAPQDGQGPFAAIGNFIQRLHTNFAEGSDSIKHASNELPLSLGLISNRTTTTTTTTTTTPAPPTTTPFFKPPLNPFNSINAILDNISRGSSSNNNLGTGNNDIFGSVPGRFDSLPNTTPAPFLPLTTRQPFNLEGINQGINAFFQAFIKTNLDKLFKGQDQPQHAITTRRSDPPELQQQRQPSFGEIILNSLFNKRQQQ